MKPDGGPAFPLHIPGGSYSHAAGGASWGVETLLGMSLRDYFAAAALHEGLQWSASQVAARAYEIADAMLAERAK